jgi:hypothetical protein
MGINLFFLILLQLPLLLCLIKGTTSATGGGEEDVINNNMKRNKLNPSKQDAMETDNKNEAGSIVQKGWHWH